ncbi:hypothetical protein LOC67_10855 [Stieleria sp. JC731]|uniref:hypothetical protein n=1 Tax=Pirellulaceae TaxID=2691357 RepID=UPI001E58413C|nr:hypothetical protein [Stieleria sp. JC731]MCC9601045.1 hypothetical protein [Stieleria sp. JC731]
MNTTKKFQLATTIVAFSVLYAFGWLWPLIRISLSLGGFAAVILTLYLAVTLVTKRLKRDSDRPPLRGIDFVPVLGTMLVAILIFGLLAVVPSGRETDSEERTVTTREHSVEQPEPHARSPKREKKASTTQAPSLSEDDEASRAAAEFLGALLGASAEQQRRQQNDPRYQRFKQSIENTAICPRCGGAGVYRYVDGNGVLQSRSCPSCYGSGRSF